jgi:signal transduction histidine kinase
VYPAPALSPRAREAWTLECFSRERREYLVGLAAASFIFPAYYLADRWLEPQLGYIFGVLRGAAAVQLVVAAFLVRNARSIASARAVFSISLGLSSAMVAVLLPRVEHYAIYLVGYSLYFWGTFLLSWPVWLAVATFAWHLAVVAAGLLLTPSHRAPADYLFAALFLGSAAVLTSLSTLARRTAHAREFGISSALAERNNELASALTTLRDAQARLVAQEKLSALGRMLAGLSHEMNNPVNVLKNNLDPIREHFTELRELAQTALSGASAQVIAAEWEAREIDWRTEDFDDALNGMDEAAARCGQVNADLRAFIRGDAVSITLANPRDGLRATVALISRRVPERVHLALQLDDTPELPCHPGKLNQVWLNLIQNALDAVGSSGTVRVECSVVRDHVEIVVQDDGPGVTAAFRSRLFEPFATTKGVGAGTGLGLATSYQIVELHGGRLYLDETHSPGARFVVELPIPREAQAQTAHSFH